MGLIALRIYFEPCMKPRGPHRPVVSISFLSLKAAVSLDVSLAYNVSCGSRKLHSSELEMSWMMRAVEPAATDRGLYVLVCEMQFVEQLERGGDPMGKESANVT